MKTSSKDDLRQMKAAAAKKDWVTFDRHRMAILSRYNVSLACTFEILMALSEKMPKDEAQEYARLVYDAAVEDVRCIHRKKSKV